jgi:hypothetical protein
MHPGPELSIDHTDYLVTILANQKVIDVLQDARAKGERDAMFAVGETGTRESD